MTTLVLMLTKSWMTRFGTYDINDGMETYAPLITFVIMVYDIFGALTIIDKEKYHIYLKF